MKDKLDFIVNVSLGVMILLWTTSVTIHCFIEIVKHSKVCTL